MPQSEHEVIWLTEYFCAEGDWTAKIKLICFNKIAF